MLESDPPETVRRRLGRHEILGLTLGLEAPSDLHPLAAGIGCQAWVGFLEELVADRPAVVLVEDLYWGEEAPLDVFEGGLHDVQGPLLLLGTSRDGSRSRSVLVARARGRCGAALARGALLV